MNRTKRNNSTTHKIRDNIEETDEQGKRTAIECSKNLWRGSSYFNHLFVWEMIASFISMATLTKEERSNFQDGCRCVITDLK